MTVHPCGEEEEVAGRFHVHGDYFGCEDMTGVSEERSESVCFLSGDEASACCTHTQESRAALNFGEYRNQKH